MKPDQYYTDVICRPISARKATSSAREVEVTAEDEQQFLFRQQQYLLQGAPPAQSAATAAGSVVAGMQKPSDRKSIGSPAGQGSPTKKVP